MTFRTSLESPLWVSCARQNEEFIEGAQKFVKLINVPHRNDFNLSISKRRKKRKNKGISYAKKDKNNINVEVKNRVKFLKICL